MSDQRDESSITPDSLPSQPRKSRQILAKVTLALVGLVMVASVVVFFVVRNNPFDRSLGTYAFIGGLFLSVTTLWAWFVLFSQFSGKFRVRVNLLLIVVVGTTVAMVRIEGFDGVMRPNLRWRWARRPGEIVGEVEVASNVSQGIDLTTTTPDDFPQFLGPDRNQYLPGPSLDRDWKSHPPQLVWRHEIGAGWSPFVARNGYAVTLEQVGDEERVTCYEIVTGRLCWKNAIQARHDSPLGGLGPRSAPTLDEGRVYAQGATGVLRCLDGASGKEIWRYDLLAEHNLSPEDDRNAIAWGRAGSPLIVGDLVVIPAGGPAEGPVNTLIALDKLSGDVIWKGGKEQIGYGSPSLVQLGGMQQILLVGESEVSGFDPADGRKLWEFPLEGHSNGDVNASQPVVVGDDLVFASKGYGTGALLAQVRLAADGWSAEILWDRSSLRRAVMRTKFTNVVVVDGFIYGLDDSILQCIRLDTGQQMWRGQRRRAGDYGHGQMLRVGDVLLVLTETGELVMVDLTPEKLIELGRVTVLDGKTWNNLCLYGQFLLVRNNLYAACYRLPVNER